MLIRMNSPSKSMNIVSKFMLHSKVIFIGMTSPDDTGHGNLKA